MGNLRNRIVQSLKASRGFAQDNAASILTGLGNPSTGAWLAGGSAALLAYLLSGSNKKLKKNTLLRLLLSGGAGLAAIGGVNAWDRYKARKAPAPPQETFSDDTEDIQEAANTSAAILEQERAVAEQQQQQPQQPASTQQTPRGTFSDLTEEAILEQNQILAASKQEQDRAIAEAMQERARIEAEKQQQLFSRAERSANATSTQAPQPTRTSTPTRALTDKERLEQRYGYLPILHAQEWVEDASKVSRYATPAIGAVGGWFAGGALDNKFMKADGVYRGNPYVAPKTRLGKMVEHVRNPAYSAAQGGAKVRSGLITYDAAMRPVQQHWVDYQKDAPMGTGNIVRGAVARGAGAGAGALIGAGIDKYIANPLLSSARRYLLHK